MTPCAVLDRLGHPRVLVVGDLMLDRYVWGDADRVSPEAPVLVLREEPDQREIRPGGAANVASFLHALEAEVAIAGIIGDDPEGRALRRLMSDLDLQTRGILTDRTRPTTVKHRFVGRTACRQPQQILRVDSESRQPLDHELQQRLIEAILPLVPSCQAVLISDYGKGVCSPALLQSLIETARANQIPVLIDPARQVDYSRYAHATSMTPNRAAAEQVIGHPLRDPDSIRRAAIELRSRLDLESAVLTLDRDGLAYATGTESGVVSCRPRSVCDVTGAGDMVLAVLGLCRAANRPLVDSLHLANAAAGLEVERFGVEPVTRLEIARELGQVPSAAGAPRPLDELLVELAAERRSGKSIVFTNGCFDLLHVGHVSMLQDAARLGDVLVVAINSDASVRRLKGTDRPIIGQQDRARMLAALACVDHVLIFDDDTPHRLLQAIRPDVLVKGGTTGHIVGREVVEGYGGQIVQTSVIAGLSTTALVSRLTRQPVSTVP